MCIGVIAQTRATVVCVVLVVDDVHQTELFVPVPDGGAALSSDWLGPSSALLRLPVRASCACAPLRDPE